MNYADTLRIKNVNTIYFSNTHVDRSSHKRKSQNMWANIHRPKFMFDLVCVCGARRCDVTQVRFLHWNKSQKLRSKLNMFTWQPVNVLLGFSQVTCCYGNKLRYVRFHAAGRAFTRWWTPARGGGGPSKSFSWKSDTGKRKRHKFTVGAVEQEASRGRVMSVNGRETGWNVDVTVTSGADWSGSASVSITVSDRGTWKWRQTGANLKVNHVRTEWTMWYKRVSDSDVGLSACACETIEQLAVVC